MKINDNGEIYKLTNTGLKHNTAKEARDKGGRMMLEKSKGYPWRPSLTKKARCGMCKHKRGSFGLCSQGHNMKYPTLANVHNCKDYDYEELPFEMKDTFALTIVSGSTTQTSLVRRESAPRRSRRRMHTWS